MNYKELADILKKDLKGFCICQETGHGWIYGTDWWIEF